MGIRQTKKEQRRLAIEEAALAMFLAEGYERTSVERIAEQVGMARGTFYLYYPDKLALFEELCGRLYSPMVEVLENTARALHMAASIHEHQFIYLSMAGGMANLGPQLQPFLGLHFREVRSAGPAGEVVARWLARIESLGEGILRDAAERGLLTIHDAYTVVLAIIGAVERLTWAWLSGDPRLDRDRAALELSAVFFRGLHGVD